MTRILIAERDATIASLLQMAVGRALECDMVLAADPAASAAALESCPFELIILDIGMYSGGLDILPLVGGRNAECEVIALTTGIIQAPLLKTLADADVYAIVTKPFDVAQFTAIVSEVLRFDRVADPNQTLVYRKLGEAPTHE
jgi:DNA-binding NtrC family response regulator